MTALPCIKCNKPLENVGDRNVGVEAQEAAQLVYPDRQAWLDAIKPSDPSDTLDQSA